MITPTSQMELPFITAPRSLPPGGKTAPPVAVRTASSSPAPSPSSPSSAATAGGASPGTSGRPSDA